MNTFMDKQNRSIPSRGETITSSRNLHQPESTREGIHVLVVDDDQRVRNAFRRILTPAGDGGLLRFGAGLLGEPHSAASEIADASYNLTLSPNGEAALAAVTRAVSEKRPYALAYVDMRMPGISGIEAVKRFGEIDPRIRIVIATAYNDISPEEIIAATGRRDIFYLLKPVHAEEIRQMTRVLCEQWKSDLARFDDCLPICSFCKNIRNDEAQWEEIDHYLASHTPIQFTHCVCPECMKKHYPEFAS